MQSYSNTRLWTHLPYEIYLNIFRSVFITRFNDVIRVQDTPSGISLHWNDRDGESMIGGAICCLDVAVFGARLATAAAEALYQSNFTFAVDAESLPRFLRLCPLSRGVHPRRYVERIFLYVDEEPNFVGDGKHTRQFPETDWAYLERKARSYGLTSLVNDSVLMRQCWEDLMKMPKLRTLVISAPNSGTLLRSQGPAIGAPRALTDVIHLDDLVDLSGCLPLLCYHRPAKAQDRYHPNATIAGNEGL